MGTAPEAQHACFATNGVCLSRPSGLSPAPSYPSALAGCRPPARSDGTLLTVSKDNSLALLDFRTMTTQRQLRAPGFMVRVAFGCRGEGLGRESERVLLALEYCESSLCSSCALLPLAGKVKACAPFA